MPPDSWRRSRASCRKNHHRMVADSHEIPLRLSEIRARHERVPPFPGSGSGNIGDGGERVDPVDGSHVVEYTAGHVAG